ncbi:hypothetical protein J2847_004115 [Azospirillum agricola]|uniref:hypothetical protein n=1 Tax=Azospirillum agricola TaxID=1720247 RepID=UPI001AE21971|nr:hypothetical protein [Azospirillum agricola]MBP2230806.1 hypothetical protein [Azospirillum agricola]
MTAVPEVALATMPGIGDVSADRIARMKLTDILPLAQTEEDLRRVAAIKGYKRGWVQRVLNDRAAAKAHGYMQRRYG